MREWLTRHWVALALSIGLAVGMFWLLRFAGLPLVPRAELLAHVEVGAIVLHSLLYCAALYVRSHRWVWLLEPIPEARGLSIRRIVSVSFVGWGAMVVMPFRTGEVVRPALLRIKGKLSGWTVAATVAAERIVDGIVLSALLLVGLLLASPRPGLSDSRLPLEAIWKAAYLAFGVFVAAFALLAVFYWRRELATRMVHMTIGRLSARVGTQVASAVHRLADGLAFLLSAKHAFRFVGATILYFALFAASVQVLVAGSGMQAPGVVEACVIAGLMHLGAMLPNAPGYFGTYQLSVYAGLAMFHPAAEVSEAGSAAVFVMYVLQMGLPILMAIAALAVLRISPAGAMAAAVDAERDSR